MALVRRTQRRLWDPFAELLDLHDEINRIFNRALTRRKDMDTERYEAEFIPALDVIENKENFVVRAELPGVEKDAVQVTFSDGQLILKGEKKHEEKKEDENYYYVERAYGRFQRAIDLPSSVDPEKIKATYKNGVLEVVIPKKEEAKPKKIEVQIG